MGNLMMPAQQDIPAVSRFLMYGYPLLSLILLLLQHVFLQATLLMWNIFNCSLQSMQEVRLWTLFTSPFYQPFSLGFMGLLNWLFQIMMIAMCFPNKERQLGSFRFLLWLMLAGAAANLVFLAFMGALTGFSKLRDDGNDLNYYDKETTGMWPLILVVFSLQQLGNPDATINFFGLVQIPAIYHPAALMILNCYINGQLMWNCFAAVAVGYIIYARPALHFERLLPSQARISGCDKRCCGCGCFGGKWLSGSDGYVVGAGSQRPVSNQRGQPPRAAAKPTLFSGAGNRLGDGSGASRQPLLA